MTAGNTVGGSLDKWTRTNTDLSLALEGFTECPDATLLLVLEQEKDKIMQLMDHACFATPSNKGKSAAASLISSQLSAKDSIDRVSEFVDNISGCLNLDQSESFRMLQKFQSTKPVRTELADLVFTNHELVEIIAFYRTERRDLLKCAITVLCAGAETDHPCRPVFEEMTAETKFIDSVLAQYKRIARPSRAGYQQLNQSNYGTGLGESSLANNSAKNVVNTLVNAEDPYEDREKNFNLWVFGWVEELSLILDLMMMYFRAVPQTPLALVERVYNTFAETTPLTLQAAYTSGMPCAEEGNRRIVYTQQVVLMACTGLSRYRRLVEAPHVDRNEVVEDAETWAVAVQEMCPDNEGNLGPIEQTLVHVSFLLQLAAREGDIDVDLKNAVMRYATDVVERLSALLSTRSTAQYNSYYRVIVNDYLVILLDVVDRNFEITDSSVLQRLGALVYAQDANTCDVFWAYDFHMAAVRRLLLCQDLENHCIAIPHAVSERDVWGRDRRDAPDQTETEHLRANAIIGLMGVYKSVLRKGDHDAAIIAQRNKFRNGTSDGENALTATGGTIQEPMLTEGERRAEMVFKLFSLPFRDSSRLNASMDDGSDSDSDIRALTQHNKRGRAPCQGESVWLWIVNRLTQVASTIEHNTASFHQNSHSHNARGGHGYSTTNTCVYQEAAAIMGVINTHFMLCPDLLPVLHDMLVSEIRREEGGSSPIYKQSQMGRRAPNLLVGAVFEIVRACVKTAANPQQLLGSSTSVYWSDVLSRCFDFLTSVLHLESELIKSHIHSIGLLPSPPHANTKAHSNPTFRDVLVNVERVQGTYSATRSFVRFFTELLKQPPRVPSRLSKVIKPTDTAELLTSEVVPKMYLRMRLSCKAERFRECASRAVSSLKGLMRAQFIDVLSVKEIGLTCTVMFAVHDMEAVHDTISFEQFEVDADLHVLDVTSTSVPSGQYEQDMHSCLMFLLNEVYVGFTGWRYQKDIREMHQIGSAVLQTFETVLCDLPVAAGDVVESELPISLRQSLLYQTMYDDRAANLCRTLLRTVCTGQSQLRALYTLRRLEEAVELERLIVRTFKLLNLLLQAALSASDGNTPLPPMVTVMLRDGGVCGHDSGADVPLVKAIAEYIDHRSESTELGKMPVLAVDLLSKLCDLGAVKGAPRLSMAIHFDANEKYLRNRYTTHLCNPQSDPELRLALTKFYTVAMQTQPGLAFMFLDIEDPKESGDKYIVGDHSCLKLIFETLSSPTTPTPRLLHAIVSLLLVMWQSTADYRHVVALRQWDGAKIWELLGDLMDEDDHALIFEDVEIQNAADVEHVCYLTATRGVVVDLVALELYANFQRARTVQSIQNPKMDTKAEAEGRIRNTLVSEMNPKLKTLVTTLLDKYFVGWVKSLTSMAPTAVGVTAATRESMGWESVREVESEEGLYEPSLAAFRKDSDGRVFGPDYVYDTKLLSAYLEFYKTSSTVGIEYLESARRLNTLLSSVDCQMALLRSLRTLVRAAAPYVTIDCGSGAKAPAAPGPIRLAYDHFLVADDGLLSSLRRFHRYNMGPQGLDVACSEITELAHLAAEAYHESLYALLSRTVHVVLTSWVTHGPALAAIESALVLIGAVSTSAQPGAGDCSPARMEATPTPAPRATPFSDTSFATPSQTPHSQHLPNSQSRSYMEPLCGMLDVLRRRIGDATTMPGNVTNASQKRVANAAADGAGVDMVDCGVGGRGVEENYMQIEGTTLFAADGSLVGQCGDSVCAEGEAGADTQESFNTQKYLNSYHADFFAGILCLLETYDYSSTTVSLPTASAPASSGTVPTKVSIAPTLSTIGRGRAAHKGASPSAGTSVRGGKQLSTRMKHALYRLLESCCFVVYKTLVAAPALSFPFDTPPTAQANGPQTCANNTHPNNQSRDHGKGAANGTSRDRLQQSGISATLFRINVLIIETIVRMLMVHSEAVYPTTGSGPPSASTASVVWRVLHRTSVCEMDPLYLNREYSYGSIFEPLLSNMNTWIRTKRYPLLIGSCLRLLTTISLFSPGANIMSPLGPISTLSAALDAQIHQYERHSQHPTHSQRDSMQHNQQMSARNPIPDLGSVNGQSEQSMYSLPALANTAIAGLPMKYTGLPVCTFDGPIAYYLQDRRHNQWHTVFCQVLCLYTSMLHTLKARAVGEAVSFLIVHYERLMRCLRRSNDSSGRVVSVAEMEELVAVSAFMAALADAGVFSWKPEIHLSQYRAILDEKMELIPKHVLETVLYYTTLLSKACDYEDTQLVIPVTRSEREQEQTPAPIRLLSARAHTTTSAEPLMAPKRTTTANADSTSNKRRRGGNPLLRKCEVDIHVSLSHLMQFLKIMTPPVISRAHTYEPQQDLLRRYRTPTNIRALSGIAAYHELCLNLTINTNHITERINTTQPVSRRRGASQSFDGSIVILRQRLPLARDFCLYVLLNQERLVWYANTDPAAYKDLNKTLDTEFKDILEVSDNLLNADASPVPNSTPGQRRASSMSPSARKQSVFRRVSRPVSALLSSPSRPNTAQQSESHFWHALVNDRPRPDANP